MKMMRRSRTAEKSPHRPVPRRHPTATSCQHFHRYHRVHQVGLNNDPPTHPPRKISSLRHLSTESQNFSLDPRPLTPSRISCLVALRKKSRAACFTSCWIRWMRQYFGGNLWSQWRLHHSRFDSAEGRASADDYLLQFGETFSVSPASMDHGSSGEPLARRESR
jgi:hypothetical protein